LKVTFWGVRGSIPVPGQQTTNWGGNSSCIEVRHGDLPPLILDCGTGARALGHKLAAEPGRQLDLLFTHLHMDHLFGLPFFAPLYTPGYKVRIAIPSYSPVDARQKINRYMNGMFHPVRLRDVPAELEFVPVRPGTSFDFSGYTVRTLRLNHPGGSIGYRVDVGQSSVAYITDTAPFARPGEGLAAGEEPNPRERRVRDFLSGCDTVVYDTMYDLHEYLEKMTWGHSYPEYAMALCRPAGVRRLVLFHHVPDASDEVLDERAARYADVEGIEVIQAREGATLQIEAAAPAASMTQQS
jgi:phosphoribosyl 1,2-cyclic phosphodiesterase